MTKRERQYRENKILWKRFQYMMKHPDETMIKQHQFWYWTPGGIKSFDKPLPPVTVTISRQALNK